jgi:hypothetical protein
MKYLKSAGYISLIIILILIFIFMQFEIIEKPYIDNNNIVDTININNGHSYLFKYERYGYIDNHEKITITINGELFIEFKEISKILIQKKDNTILVYTYYLDDFSKYEYSGVKLKYLPHTYFEQFEKDSADIVAFPDIECQHRD